jgi:hypothetical protein
MALPVPGTQQNESVKTLADVLVTLGALDVERAKQIKLIEVQTGRAQEDIIKSQNLANESALSKAKAELYNIPYMDLEKQQQKSLQKIIGILLLQEEEKRDLNL